MRSAWRIPGAGVVGGITLLMLAALALGAVPPDWPPFLRGREEYPEQIAADVRRLWGDATFTRTVTADPAPVPLSFYLRFLDAPDVAAAAARHLRLTTYEVTVRDNGWYEVTNGGGMHGVYRILARDGERRAFLSRGTHRGGILGTVGGSALAQLELGDEGGRATQRLTVNAIIDHGIVARITRPFLLFFGWFVDRKLAEAFQTTAAAAAWAYTNRDDFCAWLGRTATGDRRAELLDVFDECGGRLAAPTMP